MTAPYHDYGYVANAMKVIRTFSDDAKGITARYSDSDLVAMFLCPAIDKVTLDIYASGDSIPHARLNVAITAGVSEYMLPPNIGEIHRLAKISATTGLPEWEVLPENLLHPNGPGILFQGLTSFKMIPYPVSDSTLQIDYTPNGRFSMHQNATPLYTENGDHGTVRITSSSFMMNAKKTSWTLGQMDRRPNAYLGQVLRILGTSNDREPPTAALSNCPFFPLQERPISSLDIFSGLTLTPSVNFNSEITWTGFAQSDQVNEGSYLNELRTYFVYEVVPDVDAGLVHLAAMDVARTLQAVAKNSKGVALLDGEFQRLKRAILLRWANMEHRVGNRFETLTADMDPYNWGGLY